MVLEQVGRDKNIDKSVLINALEAGDPDRRQAHVRHEPRDGGQVQLGDRLGRPVPDRHVVDDDDAIEGREITVADATRPALEAELGDELLFPGVLPLGDDDRAREQDEKFGALIDLKNASKKFGRIAAQTAKQVSTSAFARPSATTSTTSSRTARARSSRASCGGSERGALVVDIGKAEAVLPMREQVPRESYRVGDTIKAYCLDIDRNARGPQVILSRTHKGLLEKLFEQEVPESTRRSCGSSRAPRARSARQDRGVVARSRRRPGRRVRRHEGQPGPGSGPGAAWREDRHRAVRRRSPRASCATRSAPAEVSRVIIDAEGHRMELIVPDDKLSLAIGKKGQNVRLASQLTGWRIDIHSESKIYELERRAKEQISQAIDSAGFDNAVADTLFKLGWRSVGELGSRARRGARRAHPVWLAPRVRAGSSILRSSTWRPAAAAATTRARRSSAAPICRAPSSCSSSTAWMRTCSLCWPPRTFTRPTT